MLCYVLGEHAYPISSREELPVRWRRHGSQPGARGRPLSRSTFTTTTSTTSPPVANNAGVRMSSRPNQRTAVGWFARRAEGRHGHVGGPNALAFAKRPSTVLTAAVGGEALGQDSAAVLPRRGAGIIRSRRRSASEGRCRMKTRSPVSGRMSACTPNTTHGSHPAPGARTSKLWER